LYVGLAEAIMSLVEVGGDHWSWEAQMRPVGEIKPALLVFHSGNARGDAFILRHPECVKLLRCSRCHELRAIVGMYGG
jgi:hypothetical protein